MNEQTIPSAKNVWLRAFYGFNPEDAGYIGFSKKKNRETMFKRMQDGDLVVIYGATEDLTDPEFQQQVLGILEIKRERCKDRDRMNQASIDWKNERGVEDRWTHGIKISRAWRFNNRVHIRTIAPEAFQNENRFERTTRAMILSEQERERALSHTVYQVNVYGEPPIEDEELQTGQMAQILKPSRGIPPSLGERQITFEDGENQLYLMVFSEPAEYVLGLEGNHVSQALVKIGRSNDPARRWKEMNAGFPDSSIIGWKLIQTHPLPDANTAHRLENELKEIFAEQFQSKGGEFFTGAQGKVESAFHDFCCANMRVIHGAAGYAKGVK